jgi:hypothetical protein
LSDKTNLMRYMETFASDKKLLYLNRFRYLNNRLFTIWCEYET